MRKAVMPKGHSVVNPGISNHDRFRGARHVTITRSRRGYRRRRGGNYEGFPIDSLETSVVNRGLKLKLMATIKTKHKSELI